MPDFLPYTVRQLDTVLSLIGDAVYTTVDTLKVTAFRTTEPVSYQQRTTGEKLELFIGQSWGKLFDCAWFHFTGVIPAEAVGKPVALLLDVNGEMCVFDDNGVPRRGLTNVASEYDYSLGKPGKHVLKLTSNALENEPVNIWADAGCNDLFGRVQENGVIKEAFIAICREDLRALYYDFEVLLDFLKCLPSDSLRGAQILRTLNDASWMLASDLSEKSVASAQHLLQGMLAKQGGDPSLNISAIGHAHMDLGWLWPVRETHRKGIRTFATALANMDLYPNYIFGASQPQLFQWLKEDAPALYEKVKQRVREGRLEPQGAMWVEADTNVPGGEALVRQILYGKRFFKQEFGADIHYLWLPDVFGYSGALPQILQKGGVDTFMTQKLSWNLINHFPHHSFHWQGIDGTSILAYMLPEETYNSPALPRAVAKIEKNYHEKDVSDQSLLLFGIGDGGGGPGEEHLERMERIHNLAGLSPVTQRKAAEFFDVWKKDASRFPAWVGELYLERHTGTLTTQARNKWYNRRMEQALRELEWIALLTGSEYPSARLEAIWKEALLYQFHDILPGSSIKRVYDESLARYKILLAEVETLIQQAQDALIAQLDLLALAKPVVAFNSLSWPRTQWIQAGNAWVRVTVPSLGYTSVDAMVQALLPDELTASPEHLENEILSVDFSSDGSLSRVFDKSAHRDVLPAGQHGNRLEVYRDDGDAWDIPLDYGNQVPHPFPLVSSSARVDGPRAIVTQVYRLGHSQLSQEIILTSGSARLDFVSRLTWRETASMLRTSFPVAVHAEEATFEIQYGHIRRPTHRNTTWDLAKDEVAAHKWIDLSQRDYGAALINDSKYGHKVKNGVLELNLLRSVPHPGPVQAQESAVQPGQPDPVYTDQADHVFSYAFFPHPGDCISGNVVRTAYEFNYPLRVRSAQSHQGTRLAEDFLLEVDHPNIVVEAVKKAEDSASTVVRLYEAAHASAHAVVRFANKMKTVAETDLMEEEFRLLASDTATVELDFKPFEIKTIIVS
jgi:alpha-mannosidase